MSNLRRQAAKALGDQLQSFCNLPQPFAIINAPPSTVPEYPCGAILLDHFVREYADWEPEVDSDGNLLVGARLTLTQGVNAAMIQPGVQLEIIGQLRASGRIFVGARYASKREELEDLIDEAFIQERGTPGRIVCTIQEPRVGNYTLPWPWTAHAFINDSDWTPEFAFNERLWAWLKFDLDVAMLAARHDPMVQRFLVEFDVHPTQPTADGNVVDLDGGADNEQFELTVPIPEA